MDVSLTRSFEDAILLEVHLCHWVISPSGPLTMRHLSDLAVFVGVVREISNSARSQITRLGEQKSVPAPSTSKQTPLTTYDKFTAPCRR